MLPESKLCPSPYTVNNRYINSYNTRMKIASFSLLWVTCIQYSVIAHRGVNYEKVSCLCNNINRCIITFPSNHPLINRERQNMLTFCKLIFKKLRNNEQNLTGIVFLRFLLKFAVKCVAPAYICILLDICTVRTLILHF